MKRIILILCLMSSLNFVYAQEHTHKIAFNVGSGLLIEQGNGVFCIENELSYKFNNYISGSVSAILGRELGSEATNYLLTGTNCFVSPFKNNKRNNFKIGLGLGFGFLDRSVTASIYVADGDNPYYQYSCTTSIERTSALIATFIIEDEYWLNSRFSIGGKLFFTGFPREGFMGGMMVKLGVSI